MKNLKILVSLGVVAHFCFLSDLAWPETRTGSKPRTNVKKQVAPKSSEIMDSDDQDVNATGVEDESSHLTFERKRGQKTKNTRLKSFYLSHAGEGQNILELDYAYRSRTFSYSGSAFVSTAGFDYGYKFKESFNDLDLNYERGVLDWLSAKIGMGQRSRETDYSYDVTQTRSNVNVNNGTSTILTNPTTVKSFYRSKTTNFPVLSFEAKLHGTKDYLDLFLGLPLKYLSGNLTYDKSSAVSFYELNRLIFYPYLALSVMPAQVWRTGLKTSYSLSGERVVSYSGTTTKTKITDGSQLRFDFYNEIQALFLNPSFIASYLIQYPWNVSGSTDSGKTYGPAVKADGFRAWVFRVQMAIPILTDVELKPGVELWKKSGNNLQGQKVSTYKDYQVDVGLNYTF